MSTGWIRPVSGLAASQVVVYWAVFVSQFPLIVPLDSMVGALSRGSRTPGVVKGDIRVTGLTPQSRNTSARSALRRLSSITSALSHHKE